MEDTLLVSCCCVEALLSYNYEDPAFSDSGLRSPKSTCLEKMMITTMMITTIELDCCKLILITCSALSCPGPMEVNAVPSVLDVL